jgi:foldase protein PrsA
LIPALGAFFVLAVGLSGCGSGVPGNSVADVAGSPITLTAFNHWMVVAAKSQAVQNPGAPVIVPTDPPKFASCIAAVRSQIPNLANAPAKQLRADCKTLFTSLSGTVMDFLIKAYWYQAEAARQHITVTNAQVQTALNRAVQAQFPSPAQFQSFLTQTGQTMQDVLYRFRVQQVYVKLLQKLSGKVTDARIRSYYYSNLSKFGTPEARDIRIILTKTQAQATAARAALAAGQASPQTWAAVAKQYSIDSTTKDKGGLLTGVTQGSQDAALD